MISLLLSLWISGTPALAAPDRIGNGGGLWACYAQSGDLQTAALVDFYEAENEFSWTLVNPSQQDPMLAVDEVDASLKTRFPDYISDWDRALGTVKSRFHLLNGELKVIEDSLWRSKPLPSLCRTGWQYLQFANYNDDLAIVQVRKDLWESPVVSTRDKAGLIWHEVIYRWMRDQFGDTNSVRARQIVGILFSNMGDDDAHKALAAVLKQGQGDPDKPGDPVFVCMIQNEISHRWYLDYGKSELAAHNQTLTTCQLGDANWSFHCDEEQERCDSFTSQKQSFTCSIMNAVSHKVFTETGRSALEAEAKARRSCGEAEYPFQCGQGQDVRCN
jgi:hypothetical protein